MSVVSDASVLIFLGKLRRLDVPKALFKGPYYLSDLVKNELFAKGLPPSEEDYLTQGLRPWETISWHPRAARLSGGLSASDISVLEIAKKMNSEWVLADEKPLRQVLSVRRHKVIGTLGILLMARRQDIISLKQTHEMVDELVSAHRFRISAEIYRSFLKILSEP